MRILPGLLAVSLLACVAEPPTADVVVTGPDAPRRRLPRTENVRDYVLPAPGLNKLVLESTDDETPTKRTEIFNLRRGKPGRETELELMSMLATGNDLHTISMNKLRLHADQMTLYETVTRDAVDHQQHRKLRRPIDVVRLPAPAGEPLETWDCSGDAPADERHVCSATFETVSWQGEDIQALVVTKEMTSPTASLTVISRYGKGVGLVSEEARFPAPTPPTVYNLVEASFDATVPSED